MSAQVDQLSAYLDRGTVVYDQDEERGMFRMLFEGKHGDLRVTMIIEETILQVFTHPANKIPETHRQLITEAITRANYGLKLGNFEMDLEDGELRYQSAMPLGEEFPEDDVIDHILYVGGAMIDRYLPAFLSIVYGNEDVRLAIKAAEL